MKRRIFSVLLSSALLLTALAGCGQGGEAAPSGSSSDADSETGTRDELIFVNYRDIRDLNPHLYAGEMYAQSILYDTLVSNTEDGYVGCLAEDWTISDDGRIYTFNIRDGVTFSDGTPCDANAILANFNAILENRERHTWLEMMNLLVGVSAPDEDTFVIEMSEPYYPMLTELACIRPFAMISPNCMIDGSTMNGVNGYIGTGPYVLTDFVTDEYAVFERNENYWGEAPAIQKITVKVIPDNQTRIMALENEEIDLIFGKNMLDADAISQYVDSDRFTVSLSDPTSTRHIVLNTTHDILGDTAVRKALQHATNRQAISEGIFYGLEPAADTLYSPTVPYPAPLATPRGRTARYKPLMNGIFWIETGTGEEVLAVCYPIWNCDFSETVLKQSEQTEEDVREGIDNTLGYLFFSKRASSLALFELWGQYEELRAGGLIDYPALMNYIWAHFPEYAATYNIQNQMGMHDTFGLLMNALGTEVELQNNPNKVIAMSKAAGLDFLNF